MLTQCQRWHRETPTAATWLSQSLQVNMKHWDVQESSFHFFQKKIPIIPCFQFAYIIKFD